MPNQNYFEPREELKMATCDLSLSYPTCKTDEGNCKFAYGSWCITCDRESQRRRSKSETHEPCRKKSKDTKYYSPRKYSRSQEYENMDLEYEIRDFRSDSFRIRSNLCELPTTYITNNCQMTKVSNCPEFLDITEKGIKLLENNFKSADHNNQYPNFGSMVEKQERITKLLHKSEENVRKINGSYIKLSSSKFVIPKPHLNINGQISSVNHIENKHVGTNKTNQIKEANISSSQRRPMITPFNTVDSLDDLESLTPRMNEIYNLELQNQNSLQMKQKYTNSRKLLQNSNIVDLKFHEIPDNQNVCYDTCTFFDKQCDISDIKERYSREVEVLKIKLKELRSPAFDNHGKSELVPSETKTEGKSNYFIKTINENCIQAPENLTRDIKRVGKVYENGTVSKKIAATSISKEKRQNNDANGFTKIASDLLLRASKSERSKNGSKVSLKTKSKLKTTRLSKIRIKIPNSVSSDTDINGSDVSESEDSDKDELCDFDDSESFDELSTSSSLKEISSVPSINLLQSNVPVAKGAGDGESWPLRPSLFPHIPPYLRFMSHEAPPVKLPTGQRYLKWKLSTITPIVVRKTLTNSGFRLVRSEFSRESNEWLGTWGKHMKSPLFKTLKDTQKLNHFPGTFQIGRKDRLWRNLQRLMFRHGQKEFGFIPQTYVLPQDLKLLKHNWQHKNGSGDEKWIIKPPASARGTGIKVINRWSQLPKRMSLVVQQYISNPYLINGSKFDLRLYVLVTSFNPLRVYLYPDGLARFASVKYSDDAKDLKDRYMHLTNYSINKLSSQYTANEDANACQGHKWTLSKLWEYMNNQGVDTDSLWKNLQQLVIKTLISGESAIVPLCKENMNSRYNCYELFGIDVLLDERLKPWLLEVNISPSLHSQSPLDAHVKGPLVQSLFDLAQFHLPARLSRTVKCPPCYDPKIYTTTLNKKERNKHNYFCQVEKRGEYLDAILNDLTGDDIRHLTQAEDELTVIGQFERIFPTSHTHKYMPFLEVRYYNRLFDAWERKYEHNRAPAIKLLQSLCDKKLHLRVAPPSTVTKNLLSMNLGELNLQPMKEGQTQPPALLPAPPHILENHIIDAIPSLGTTIEDSTKVIDLCTTPKVILKSLP